MKQLTVYLTTPIFNDPIKRKLFKTLWKNKKILVTRIVSFAHNIFYPIKDKYSISWAKFKFATLEEKTAF